MKHVTRMAMMALGAMVLSSSIAVADNCKIVRGTISPLQPVACANPNPLGCFTGDFDGDLTGSFQSVLMTLSVVNAAQGMVQFTASTVLQTSTGTLNTSDAGIAVNCQFQTGLACSDSSEILKITSGTGAYAKAYGLIYLRGPYLATQAGEYQGQICKVK